MNQKRRGVSACQSGGRQTAPRGGLPNVAVCIAAGRPASPPRHLRAVGWAIVAMSLVTALVVVTA